MLSEEDRVRIRAEEQAKLEEQRARLEEKLRLEAAVQYREEVARALKRGRGARAWGWGWGVAVLLLLAGTGAAWWWLRPSSGGVLELLEAAFVQSCQEQVAARVGEGWTFPPQDQIKAALTVSAEGRSWQSFITQEGRRQSFSCLGGTVGDTVQLELFGEEAL